MMYGPCRVPLSSGVGTAKITLSYPGWQDGRVSPVTIEAAISPMSWWGLFVGYLVWPLGAAVVAATGWTIWRVWQYVRLRRAHRP